MKKTVSLLLAVCLLLSLLPVTASASGVTTGTLEARPGYDLATVRYEFADGTYGFAEFTETENGYTYSFPTPSQSFTVIPEYYSLTRWDGAVDISWYDADKTEFYLSTPAQLAGLAALVNGRTDADTPDYRVKGDLSELVSTQIDDFLLVGVGGGNQRDTVYRGDAAHDFSGKTVYLTADMDMGGVFDGTQWSGPNWTPIGGKYPLRRADSGYVIESFFNGVLDGQGHRIENLYCDRYADKGYAYSQAVGFVGYLGELYDGETAPSQMPAVRNLSVAGSIYGRRMVGGVVGRVGSIPTGVRIENCANYASVKNTDSKGIGGICGAGWGKGAIVNCYNRGSVTTTYACPAGGICGSNSGMDIYNCYNTGTIDSNGNGRGRAIGCHDSGSYTVSDCYYLEGCDDDPSANGWYVGTALNISVSVTSQTQSQMQSAEFVQALNNNGAAYVYVSGSYPLLRWETETETKTVDISVLQPTGGTVAAEGKTSVPAGTVLTLTNTPAVGYAFRNYTMNGTALSGAYATVTEDTVFSAEFEPLAPGSLLITPNPDCEITVRKTGTIMEDGVMVSVKDYPVSDGDPLYENDVLTVTATLRDGATPDDLNYIYNGLFCYHFSFHDGSGTEKATDSGVFTVTSQIADAPLTVTVEPYTTHKIWTQTVDTGWYDENSTEFTLTTPRQLAGFALLVKEGNSFAGKTVKLGCNISLSNDDSTYNRTVRWWDGIGSNVNAFSGVFDGCGYTISEMSAVTTGSNAALFLNTDGAVIKNLTVRGSASTNGGAAAIVCRGSNTQIENCVSYVKVSSDGELAAGILASGTNGCTVEGCVNYGSVTGTTAIGGIAGNLTDADSSLIDCLNYGEISGSGSSGGLGGIVGKIGGSVTRCANYGSISGANWYVGGIVGCANTLNASQITDCYNVGDVENSHAYTKAATGGIIGYGNYFVLKNGFCYGQVTAASGTVGGVVGLDSRRSTNRTENTAYLSSGCPQAVGGVENPSGAKAMEEEAFASAAYLEELNVDGCFILENGLYPEFASFCPGSKFTDMPRQGNWAHDAIDWAIENGITSGTSETTFSPTDGCTRAQVVTFLWRAAGSPEPTASQSPFTDLKAGAYYQKAVLWAVEQNITEGTSETTFSPNTICTRAQIVTFLWRFEGAPEQTASNNPFQDVKTGSYYEKAVLWAAEANVTEGTSATTFSPSNACTRAQVVTFLYRAAAQ